MYLVTRLFCITEKNFYISISTTSFAKKKIKNNYSNMLNSCIIGNNGEETAPVKKNYNHDFDILLLIL